MAVPFLLPDTPGCTVHLGIQHRDRHRIGKAAVRIFLIEGTVRIRRSRGLLRRAHIELFIALSAQGKLCGHRSVIYGQNGVRHPEHGGVGIHFDGPATVLQLIRRHRLHALAAYFLPGGKLLFGSHRIRFSTGIPGASRRRGTGCIRQRPAPERSRRQGQKRCQKQRCIFLHLFYLSQDRKSCFPVPYCRLSMAFFV